MKNECGKIHLPSFSKTCCLRHLLEMSYFSQIQSLSKKYTKLLLLTLNHSYKENSFNFSSLKLDLLILLLDVLCKYMSHFYMLQKYEYSKLLGIIAIKALKETDYKQHPEIILRECAINNNVACLYEAKEKYENAYKYFTQNKKYLDINNDFDNAILYNNLIRVCLKSKKMNEVKSYIVSFKNCLRNAIKKMKNIQIKNAFENNNIYMNRISDYSAKNELIAVLMLNLGMMLDKIEDKQNAKEVYLQGYEFSLSALGEWNFNTQKLKRKIIINVSTIKNELKDENGDSIGSNKKSSSRKNNNENEEPFSFQNSPLYQNNSKQQGNNSSSNKKGKKYSEDKALIDKINRICEFIEKYGDKIQQSSFSNDSNSNFDSKKKRKLVLYEDFKQMCKPFFKKFFQNHDLLRKNETDTNNNTKINNSQPKNKQTDLLSEVIEEFEKEKKIEKKNSFSVPKQKTIQINLHDDFLNDKSHSPKKKFQTDFAQYLNDKIIKKEEIVMHQNEKENQVVNNVVFDNATINNETSSRSNAPLVVIPVPSLIKTQNDSIISARNIVKPELQQLSKGITCNIEYENNDEVYEFKPYYKKGNAYKKTIANFVSQKKVNFFKSQAKMPPSVLGNLLFGSTLEVPKSPKRFVKQPQQEVKKKEHALAHKISISQTDSAVYEFQPYYNGGCNSFESSENNASDIQDSLINVKKLHQNGNSSNQEESKLDISFFDENHNQNDECEMQINNVETSNNNNVFTCLSTTNQEEIFSSISNSCIDFEDDLDSDGNINFYFNHSKNGVDIYSYFDHLLLSNHKSNIKTKPYIISLPFQNETYNIIIKNEPLQKRLQFSLFKNTSQLSIYSPINVLCVEYSKLNKIIQKLHIYHSIPFYYDINYIETFDDLIRKIISTHTIIIKKENQLSIGLSAKPNGINGDKQITFSFLKTQCCIDIIVISNNILRIIVSNLKSMQITLNIDCFCDKSSFDLITKEIIIKSESFLNSNEYVLLTSYQFNEEQISTIGFIPAIMKKVQEIMKVKFTNGEIEGFEQPSSSFSSGNSIYQESKGSGRDMNNHNEITLAKVYKSFNEIMFKCEVENKGKDISIVLLNFKPSTMTFSLEKYNKNETNIKPISSLNNNSITSIFECFSSTEAKLMYERISDREQTVIKYVIINSYNYKDNNEIVSLQQESIFSFMFMPKGNDTQVVINFSFNKYIENACYIGKFIAYDSSCQGVYSIFFFPKEQDSLSINKAKETLKNCEKNKMKSVLFNIYLDYIRDNPQRTVDSQDMKPLRKFLPLSYLLMQCK